MSAIFGIIDFEGRPLKEEWIKSMQADLAHRGPDGQGLYREPSVALGHMLLQVTPESVYDKSPYEEDGLVITANARLDEREAIMDRLDIPKEERDKITDPLLLLRSFKKYGKDFVKDIYGDFAFAIWDKNKRELFCARDQMGVKPFLYYHKDGRFVFSTEIKSLVKMPFIDAKLDNNVLKQIEFLINPKQHLTIWENIYRLKQAQTLIISKVRFEIKRYWLPRYNRNNNLKSSSEAAFLLLDILNTVISDHTRAIGTIGSHLSGGLDSSTITCLVARKLLKEGKEVLTVSSVLSSVFDHNVITDERRYIQSIILQESNIKSILIEHTDLEFLRNVYLKFDQEYGPIKVFHYLDDEINKHFKSNHVRRVLSGYMGDETISNGTINPLPYLLINGRFLKFIELLKLIRRNSKITYLNILKKQFFPLLIPKSLEIYHKQKAEDLEWSFNKWPFYLDQNDLYMIRNEKKKQLKIKQNLFDLSNEIFSIDVENVDEGWDCSLAHYDIEMTYPFIDRRIIEFLLIMPIEYFYSDGLKRGLIRKTMKDIIPENIRLRKDKGFYSPAYNFIFHNDIEKIKETLMFNDNSIRNKNHFNIIKIINLFEEIEKSSNFDINNTLVQYWSLLALFRIWLSNFNSKEKLYEK